MPLIVTLLPLQEIPERLPPAPLPDPIAAGIRFLFNLPSWFQIGGLVVGVGVAIWLLGLVWRRRERVRSWVTARRARRIGAIAAIVILVVGGAAFGGASWDYTQHDNDFCTGCHVMDPAFERFTSSEHSKLSCHDCHRQSVFASMRQLYLWVKDRPHEIGEHSPVPTEVCAECHIQADPDSTWQRISETAGHLVHLKSDSSALAEVQCVTCHGLEVHRFVPADSTCGQSGCHDVADTRIAVGAMAEQTELHCITCHEFTAESVGQVLAEAELSPLTPGAPQCFSCHDMQALLTAFDARKDPHEARCGACHNPHVQEDAQLTSESCAAAECHASADTLTPLHIGLPQGVAGNCLGCHPAHSWVRPGDNCEACHTEIPGAGRTAAATRLSAASTGAPSRWTLAASAAHAPAGWHALRQQARFDHAQHALVKCTACHSNAERHGEVIVRNAGDCFSCHHSDRAVAVGCGGCHAPRTLARSRRVQVSLRLSVWESARVRTLPFSHAQHTDSECGECHGGTTRLSVTKACTDCHDEHHAAEARCASCHEEHREDAHTARVHSEGCTGSGCHDRPTYERMQQTRTFCQACHQDMVDHEPGQLCSNCHQVPAGGGEIRTRRGS